MFFVLYDKNLQALGKRKTYPVQTWNLKRKMLDFDSLEITGFPVEFDVNEAMFVSLNEDSGKVVYSALSGIKSVQDNVTTINASDLRTIFNSEVIIDFTQTFTSVAQLYSYLINALISQNDNFLGSVIHTFTIDVSDIVDVEFDSSSIVKEKAVGNVWETILGFNAYYNLFLQVDINYINKEFILKIKRQNVNFITIKKEDFNIDLSQKVSTSTNRIVCYDETFSSKYVYYLLEDNSVIGQEDLENNLEKLVYPTKVKIVTGKTLDDAKTNGKKELLKNRYDEKVELDLTTKLGYIFKQADFGTIVDIVGYKSLPIGEIKNNSNNKNSIVLGIDKEEL